MPPGCNRASRPDVFSAMLAPVWGCASSVQQAAGGVRAAEFDALRRHEMLSSAEQSLAAAAAVVHEDPDAALDDILAARALIAAILTVSQVAD